MMESLTMIWFSGVDTRAILEMTGRLYNNIYGDYPDFKETNMMINDMMLTYSEEGELRGRLKLAMEIAQKIMRKGWTSEEIAETVNLDVSTVESLYKGKGSCLKAVEVGRGGRFRERAVKEIETSNIQANNIIMNYLTF